MTPPFVIIIGSGMGGASLADVLAPSGRPIVILEKGAALRPSPADRDARAIFGRGHFRPREEWLDGNGNAFNPGNYYYAGGNSKFYGAVLIRYRAEDLAPLRRLGGSSHGWPISYQSLEPYCLQAEVLYQVRGQIGEDPSEPPHSGTYDHAPVADEPAIADLRRRLTALPEFLASWIASRSIDLYAMSEDLPNPESRVTLRGEKIILDWKRSNWETRLALVAKLRRSPRRAGYPIAMSRAFDRRTPSHQCGTARMGGDPRQSVGNRFGRSHGHRNLFITDASVLPTSAAVNPALTIAALVLRTAKHITQTEFAS